ncbi:MAG: DUF4867 family protein [Clostridia bacterium]|nr:DUF4867 family protein [Clostridia bacterium]
MQNHIYKITDKEFQDYGQVLEGYNLKDVLNELAKLNVPENGIYYKASVDILEKGEEYLKMQERGFGGLPIQIGYVGGNNKKLNCLEYHKSSEFNIALDDVILVLGKQTDIRDGLFDTTSCKAFLVPAGQGVELYATTLHYAPMNINEKPYRVACVLPRGTNGNKPKFDVVTKEDLMCAGTNKWLMAHSESNEAKSGAYVGLMGENIAFNKLKF